MIENACDVEKLKYKVSFKVGSHVSNWAYIVKWKMSHLTAYKMFGKRYRSTMHSVVLIVFLDGYEEFRECTMQTFDNHMVL